MEFSLTPEQVAFRDEVKKFAERELVPNIKPEYDQRGEFIWVNWEKIKGYGLCGLPFPEKYGGQGASVLMTVMAEEALGLAGVDSGTIMSLNAHMVLCGVPIWLLGTEEQKTKYVTKIASGEKIGGFALTEPNHGSDIVHLDTYAVKKGDRYILNGSKMFITNGPIGDIFVVVAATDKKKAAFGLSAFIVEKDFPGFKVARELDKLGHRTSPTAELVFEDCEVPEENILGAEGLGFVEVVRGIFEWERSCLLAPAIGSMERGLKRAIEYAMERKQFGRPIIEFQAIQKKLVDMKVAIEVSRQYIYRIAWMKDNGQSAFVEASIAKLIISESVIRSSYDAVQIFGGYGYMKDFEVERGYRDARLATIGGGTSEVQKTIVARAVLGIEGGKIE
jgi:alkylation response protein AidB-like acyl-CoA dehydrogenase